MPDISFRPFFSAAEPHPGDGEATPAGASAGSSPPSGIPAETEEEARLRQRLVAARDWSDLERSLQAVQAAYQRGAFNQSAAEALARLAVRVSRTGPPGGDGLQDEALPAEAK